MGVTGLWKLLDGTGTPVTLESLEGKILAVDISIWMNMALKGMRTADAASNAHLITLFNRICKLLYFGIKPIFVFDGKMPALKKKALAQRRHQRNLQEKKSKNAAEMILQNCLKRQIIEQSMGKNGDAGGSESQPRPKVARKQDEDDMFKLPEDSMKKLPINNSSDDESGSWYERWLFREHLLSSSVSTNSGCDDMMSVDTDSKEFQNLPNEVQHEMLVEMKEIRKKNRTQMEAMPEYSENFSKYQLSGLLAKRELSEKIRKVEKTMKEKTSRDVASQFLDDEERAMYAADDDVTVDAKRLTCDDETFFVLIHRNQKKQQQKKAEEANAVTNGSKTKEVEVNEQMMEDEEGEHSTNHQQQQQDTNGGDDEIINNHPLPPTTTPNHHDNNHHHHDNNHHHHDNQITNDDDKNIVLKEEEEEEEVKNHQQQKKIETNNMDVDNGDDVIIVSDDDVAVTKEDDDVTMKDELMQEEEERPVKIRDSSTSASTSITTTTTTTITSSSEDDDDDEFVDVPDTQVADAADSSNVGAMTNDVGDVTATNHDVIMSQDATTDEARWPDDVVSGAADLQGYTKQLDAVDAALMKKIEAAKRATTGVDERIVNDCQQLLRLFGLPYVISPSEAEAQCAFLDGCGITHGTITDDSDVWLFGANVVYRNFFDRKHDVTCYKANFIESHLGLDRMRLISVALCSGCDYTSGIDGVGPVRALEIMNEFSSEDCIQSLQMFKTWWDAAHKNAGVELMTNERKLRAQLRHLTVGADFPSKLVIDAFLKPHIDESTERPTWGIPDLDSIRDFAEERMKWSRRKVDQQLLPVLRKISERATQRQTRISNFMTSSPSRQHGRKQQRNMRKKKSKRVEAAVMTLKQQQQPPPPKLSESSSSDSDS